MRLYLDHMPRVIGAPDTCSSGLRQPHGRGFVIDQRASPSSAAMPRNVASSQSYVAHGGSWIAMECLEVPLDDHLD